MPEIVWNATENDRCGRVHHVEPNQVRSVRETEENRSVFDPTVSSI